MCQSLYFVFSGVATEDAHACDITAIYIDKSGQLIFSEFRTDIFPEMFAVAVGTMIRTVGQINSQRGLIRDLLEYDIVIIIFQHRLH